MLANNFIFYSLKIITQLIYEIFYFPVWWYTRGAINVLIGLKNFLVNREKTLALWVWIKNIHRPMYGQYDWAGILISLVVRIFQIIVRSMALVFWLIFCLAVFLFWLMLPVVVLGQIAYQINF